MAADSEPGEAASTRWFSPGVAGIGTSSFLADLGHEIPTALLPSLLTVTSHTPTSALGLIEGISMQQPGWLAWRAGHWHLSGGWQQN